MHRSVLRRSSLSVICALILFNNAAHAGEVSGHVRDKGNASKQNGIENVRVTLHPEDKTKPAIDGKITDANGRYEVLDVPDGKYRLTFDKPGFVPRPADGPKIEVKDKKIVVKDFWLTKGYGTKAYFKIVAEKIVAELNETKGEKKEQYKLTWIELRKANFPPTSKADICYWIAETDKDASKVFPPLNDYLKADTKNIEKLDGMFKKALLDDNAPYPTKSQVADLKLGDEVIIDVSLFYLNPTPEANVSPSRREALHGKLISEWKGTEVAREIEKYYKKEPEKRGQAKD